MPASRTMMKTRASKCLEIDEIMERYDRGGDQKQVSQPIELRAKRGGAGTEACGGR